MPRRRLHPPGRERNHNILDPCGSDIRACTSDGGVIEFTKLYKH
jgi:hypothetical protein